MIAVVVGGVASPAVSFCNLVFGKLIFILFFYIFYFKIQL